MHGTGIVGEYSFELCLLDFLAFINNVEFKLRPSMCKWREVLISKDSYIQPSNKTDTSCWISIVILMVYHQLPLNYSDSFMFSP
jgi:hypothetical protein